MITMMMVAVGIGCDMASELIMFLFTLSKKNTGNHGV
jgi:hypothetical protein